MNKSTKWDFIKSLYSPNTIIVDDLSLIGDLKELPLLKSVLNKMIKTRNNATKTNK